MDLEQVMALFLPMVGLTPDTPGVSALCQAGISRLERMVRPGMGEGDIPGLCLAAAAYAHYLYRLGESAETGNLQAGDLHISSSSEGVQAAKALWEELLAAVGGAVQPLTQLLPTGKSPCFWGNL